MDGGVQYVMISGTKQMPMLSVDSLDIHQRVSTSLISTIALNSWC